MPEGFSKPAEAKLLEKTIGFLKDDSQREGIAKWWLAVRENANSPNWDLVSTCTIGKKPGLLLVEAKAHEGELNPLDKCVSRNPKNLQTIDFAINEASAAMGKGWGLRADSHYQMSNRFAWAWKIASLGTPVILVYLGFLNAHEMSKPFLSHGSWQECVLRYSDEIVPANVWKPNEIKVGDSGIIPLIRSADVNVAVR
jgi:hypothetical protein